MKPSEKQKHVMLALSVLISLLIAAASLQGLYNDSLYVKATNAWQMQTLAQDAINLVLIIPVLLIAALLISLNKLIGQALWSGTLLYVVYTYSIYCFAVPFNSLFLVYCSITASSFYSLLWLATKWLRNPMHYLLAGEVLRLVVASFLILVAVGFYLIWLTDIFTAMQTNTPPKTLIAAGLLTNPVHVLDLAFVLPFMVLIGVLLWRNHVYSLQFSASILVFIMLMAITVATLVLIQKGGISESLAVIGAMVGVALTGFVLLLLFVQKLYLPKH